MIIICVICTTLGKYITEQRIEAAIIWGIVEGCLMLASYHICVYICKKERNTRQEHIDDDTCNKIVLFPFTIVLGVNTVHSLLTSWFFLYLLLGVVFYEVWIAANSYLKINNQTKDSFFFTNSIAIIITPAIMESITHKILVNL